ncbi:MAG: ABC transporter ATP-binding protein [Spirochaetota bacterium]|nr:MAG: ABC transporter ATP-binding protein [Spirochaetota bacterium]
MDNKDHVIKLDDVWFSYSRERPVLSATNLVLHRGERAALLGSNGSGKSTLFHIIMGLIKPEKGKVTILGKERQQGRDFFEVRQKVGLLFQDSDDQLFCPTVAEDIAFGPLNLGKSREEARDIVKKTLEVLGLEGFDERITYKLSEGEKRLVALGTVLAMEPEVLLLDEPTTGLDKEHTRRFFDIIKSSARSYIIITHDPDLIEQSTTKQFAIKDGRVYKR